MRDCPICPVEANRDCELCEGSGLVPSVEASAEWLNRAYAAYDSDPRVNGPEDGDAFREAITNEWKKTS